MFFLTMYDSAYLSFTYGQFLVTVVAIIFLLSCRNTIMSNIQTVKQFVNNSSALSTFYIKTINVVMAVYNSIKNLLNK